MSDESEPEQNDAPLRPWSSLLIRDFALIWTASALTAVAVQIRNVTSLYQVYALSGSSMHLGLTGFFQALPFVLFGLFAGALADAFDRKKLMMVCYSLLLIPGLALGYLTLTESIQVWHIYVFGLLGSLIEVFSWPSRSAIIPRLVPRSHLMNAVTLSTMIMQTSFLVGPAIGGLFIDHLDVGYAYIASAFTIVPGILSVFLVRSSGLPEGNRRRVNLRSIFEGLEFIWIQRIILSLFLLDFGVTLVGFYRPILPIFARDIFDVGATGLGTLYGAPAIGSLLGASCLLMVGNIRRKGASVVVAAVVFAVSLALLGMARWYWLGVVAVVALGFTDAISVAMRRTVVQLLAPDAMLGRASSLITVFAQSTNALGALLAGTAAAYLGASKALLVGSMVCLMMILAISRAIPQLWRYRS
jgi:MFS family permease